MRTFNNPSADFLDPPSVVSAPQDSAFGWTLLGSRGPSYWPAPIICCFLSALWLALGGLAAVKAVWLILAVAMCINWTGATFERYAFGVYRLLPRKLRLQLGLEFSLFWWLELQDKPERRARTLRHLRVAVRAARGTALRKRLEEIAQQLAHGTEREISEVSPALRLCIVQLALSRRAGLPTRRITILPFRAAMPLVCVMAFGGMLSSWFATNAASLALKDAAMGLTLAALYFPLIRLTILLDLKFRDMRARNGLRVVYLTDEALSDPLSSAAIGFYGQIGFVFAIFENGVQTENWYPICTGGQIVFTPSTQRLSNVIEAFVENTDLLVLRSNDPVLAAKLKSATKLPQQRCLALNPNGFVPAGFDKLEPKALIRNHPASTRALNDAFSADMHHAFVPEPFWSLPFYFRLACCALLLCFKDSVALLALLCLVAVARYLEALLYQYRRHHVSREKLRAPKACSFSKRLRPARIEAALYLVAALLAGGASLLLLKGAKVPIGQPGPMPISALAASMVCLFAFYQVMTGMVACGLVAVKWTLDWNFRITVFRRNSASFGYAHKSVVMATCGRYGQVIALRDFELERTDEGYGERRESSKGAWFKVFTEIQTVLEPGLLYDWQTRVLDELDVADFAVFDWTEEVTENMRWELRHAHQRLPGDRILLVYDPALPQDVKELVAELNKGNDRQICILPLGRGRDDQYIWASHGQFEEAFGETIYQMMVNLKVEPRCGPNTPSGVGIGAVGASTGPVNPVGSTISESTV
jgi:hypothetical protein